MTAVSLEGVSKLYGRQAAVDDVSMELSAGERVALLGHNGAGKTTLMKVVLGLVRPSKGVVRVLGGAPGRPEARSAVGFLPENVAFHDALTGWETIRFYARLKRRPAKECLALIDRVGLEHAAGRRVSTYSKGMRQRLGLAQALLGEPKLLLLDEPTTGLDPALRHIFYDIVRALAAGGATVILSSHLLTELEERTDRIAIMDRGCLVEMGTLAELRDKAQLPLRFRLWPRAGHDGEVAGRLTGAAAENGALVFGVPRQDKLAALRRITELGTLIEDVDVEPPSLDALYAHFTGREAAEDAEP